jgi:hypothetical protein
VQRDFAPNFSEKLRGLLAVGKMAQDGEGHQQRMPTRWFGHRAKLRGQKNEAGDADEMNQYAEEFGGEGGGRGEVLNKLIQDAENRDWGYQQDDSRCRRIDGAMATRRTD